MGVAVQGVVRHLSVASQLSLAESSPSGTVADGTQQPDVFPVAEHVGAESETVGDLADGQDRSV